MPSSFSQVLSKCRSTLKTNANVLALYLNFVTLIIAVTAVFVALQQLGDAKRAFALNSVATIVSLYNAPKARYYDVLLKNPDLLEQDNEARSPSSSLNLEHIRYLTILNLRDYLYGIEVACSIYFDGSLDKKQRQFMADYLKGDIDLLLYGYDEDSGSVSTPFTDNSEITVDWITPEGESADKFQPYEATRSCLREWKIKLEANYLGF